MSTKSAGDSSTAPLDDDDDDDEEAFETLPGKRLLPRKPPKAKPKARSAAPKATLKKAEVEPAAPPPSRPSHRKGHRRASEAPCASSPSQAAAPTASRRRESTDDEGTFESPDSLKAGRLKCEENRSRQQQWEDLLRETNGLIGTRFLKNFAAHGEFWRYAFLSPSISTYP